MNPEHETMDRLINKVLDGESLSEREYAQLGKKLIQCPELAEEFVITRRILSDVAALPAPTPSIGFADRVMAAIDELPADQTIPVARPIIPAPWAFAILSLMVLAVSGGLSATPSAESVWTAGTDWGIQTWESLLELFRWMSAAFWTTGALPVPGLAGLWLFGGFLTGSIALNAISSHKGRFSY